MKLERLFHALVVMGGASACTEDATPSPRVTPDAAPDAGPPPGDGGPGADAEAAVCFCNVEPCCDRTQSPAVVLPGFACCWSTTCP